MDVYGSISPSGLIFQWFHKGTCTGRQYIESTQGQEKYSGGNQPKSAFGAKYAIERSFCAWHLNHNFFDATIQCILSRWRILKNSIPGNIMNSIISNIDIYSEKISKLRPFKDNNLLNQIKNFYRIDCTWSSNAIEGNNYTLSETKILIEYGLTAGGKPIKDALVALGHAKAFDYMFNLISKNIINEQDILFMHSLLLGSLENETSPGKYRAVPVFITGSKYTPPRSDIVPDLMKELLSKQKECFNKYHPVIAAAKFHKEFEFIHPFSDGNGRIGRLAMNCLLIQRDFLPVLIPPILRSEYIQYLEKAHVDDGDFLKLIARQELESQKDFCRMVEGAS